MHYHLAASRCASLLCPKCSQFAVKHDECGMSSLTTRLGTRSAAAKGCALPGNREEVYRGGGGDAGCRVLGAGFKESLALAKRLALRATARPNDCQPESHPPASTL